MINEKKQAMSLDDWLAKLEATKRQHAQMTRGKLNKDGVLKLIKDFICSAKQVPGKATALSWGYDDPNNMPSDARVDFFFMPTYLATSMLCWAGVNYPEETHALENYLTVMSGALLTCTFRGFEGHGYEALAGKRWCVQVFRAGRIEAFLQAHPGICPEFESLWEEASAIRKEMVSE